MAKLHKDKVDIIFTHAEQRRMLEIASWVKPEIITRGHFLSGIFKIKEATVVGSACFPFTFATIDIENGSIKSIDTWYYCKE